jgi:hypothetical protein
MMGITPSRPKQDHRTVPYFWGVFFQSYFGDGGECVFSLECSSLNSEVTTTGHCGIRTMRIELASALKGGGARRGRRARRAQAGPTRTLSLGVY